MSNCPFCAEVVADAVNIFLKSVSGLFAARWDLYPVVPGHVEIVPTRHVRYLHDLTNDELTELMLFADQTMQQIKAIDMQLLYETLLPLGVDETSKALLQKASSRVLDVNRPPDGFNLGMNDGMVAGQSVPHLHLHLIPRWKGDVANPRGGVRNMFQDDPYASLG